MSEDEIFGPEAAAPTPRGRAAERQEEIPRLIEEPVLKQTEQEEDTITVDTPGTQEAEEQRQRKSEIELAIDPEGQDRREENIPENDDGAYQRRKEVMVEVECM